MACDDTATYPPVGGPMSDIWALTLPAEPSSTGRLVILSDVTAEAIWEDGPHPHGTSTVVPADFEAQAYAAFENLTALLARAGACTSRLAAVRCRVCEPSEASRLKRICDEYVDVPDLDFTLSQTDQPANDPRCLLAVSAVAVL